MDARGGVRFGVKRFELVHRPTIQRSHSFAALETKPLSDTHDYDLICIGSGPAGQRCAVQAAKFGKRVALLEKRRKVARAPQPESA